jgi:hypothetical protein
MNTDVDHSFPHHFGCDVLDELPGGDGPHRYFFPRGTLAGQDGVIVRVRPTHAESWIGMFAFGKFGSAGVSRVLAMPDPERLCVVARGAGFIVSASSPDVWEIVEATPVIDVRAITDAGIVVFADHTEMLAYDARGVRWRTKRLSWDGLKIVAVGRQAIVGEYWDIRDEAMRTFEVDLQTGAATGGVET